MCVRDAFSLDLSCADRLGPRSALRQDRRWEEIAKCWRDLGQFVVCQPSNTTPHLENAPTPLAWWESFVLFPPCVCVCVFVGLCAYSFLPLSKPCPAVFTCSQLEKWAVFYKHGMGPPCLRANFLWIWLPGTAQRGVSWWAC